MVENKKTIPVSISDGVIHLTIYGENSWETIFEVPDAIDNGEATFQIIEGCFYEYKIDKGYCLEINEVVSRSKVNKSSGRLTPNIYVGTLSIDILKTDTNKKCGEVKLEVQSVKTSYRQDYRYMLQDITEKCTDLLLQQNSPITQLLETDFNGDAQSLYQRFAFIKSVLDAPEFSIAVNKILTSPVTEWKEIEAVKDVRNVRRINNSVLKQISSTRNRIVLPNFHPLKNKIPSVPLKVNVKYKTETLDNPENRFIKHALISFQSFCIEIKNKLKDNNRLKIEATLLHEKMDQFLVHSIFKEINPLKILSLNSPVLQKKEGYREIFRVWLMFDLAAKLIWKGGEDVYSGGKKDVAVLYEYWLFFKLIEIIEVVFNINAVPVEKLIEPTSDGLGLKIKQGEFLAVKGIHINSKRNLNIEFSFNRTFVGDTEYPKGGSWTKSMRPDYTLSIWPHGIDSNTAEIEELIVHIHFDAKYKVEKLKEIFYDDTAEESEKNTFKRADLLKMHAYKDAIRRTAGAYVLYPGNDDAFRKFGFHELIPGLGAFAIKPSYANDGSDALKKFLKEVTIHFMNRASQREKMSLKIYETHKYKDSNVMEQSLPEAYGKNRNMLPDETFVLVGYYRKENEDWILKNGLYNTRIEDRKGSLRLGPGEAGAKYLLLHSKHETITEKLFKITETGPKIYSKKFLVKMGYSSPTNKSHNYLVYSIEKVADKEFLNKKWNVTKLKKYKTKEVNVMPFSVTLTELMKVLVM